MLAGKHIVLGVTGSIAAYKAALLVREFKKRGADLRVVMTPSATEFITPLTLATLAGNEVVTDMFPREANKGTWHIHLGMWADVMLIAPASANTIAKLAHGFADNALTSLVLALRSPLLVAPAMDMDMYLHAATQENISTLRKRGVMIIEPESGELASGLEGVGRMPDPEKIVSFVDALFSEKKDLQGMKFLITAGPTQEAIDPVRFIGNHSSGKMGFAIARAACERGAVVKLIAGPVAQQTPSGVQRVDVVSAKEMFEAVRTEAPNADCIIMAAAVADFTPVNARDAKMKKDDFTGATMSIELQKTQDILAYAGDNKSRQVIVGFALETENGLQNAQKKLEKKNADMIVLNVATETGAGFGVDTNIVTLLTRSQEPRKLPKLPKEEVAHAILDATRELMQQRRD